MFCSLRQKEAGHLDKSPSLQTPIPPSAHRNTRIRWLTHTNTHSYTQTLYQSTFASSWLIMQFCHCGWWISSMKFLELLRLWYCLCSSSSSCWSLIYSGSLLCVFWVMMRFLFPSLFLDLFPSGFLSLGFSLAVILPPSPPPSTS